MQLPRRNNLVLDLRFYMGHCNDLSGNGNDGVMTGTRWEKRPDQHLRFAGTDVLTVADDTSLRLETGTILVFGDFDKYVADDRLVSKFDGNVNYDLRFGSAGIVKLYTVGGSRSVAIDWIGSKSIAVSFKDGEISKGYRNGLFVNDFIGITGISHDDSALFIGNAYTGVSPQPNPLKAVLIYNVVLTPTEIAQAHAEVMRQHGPSKAVTRAKKQDNNILVDGDAEAVGVGDWSAASAAILTKETGTRTGGSGSQVLRVTYDGVANPRAEQNIITIGNTYRITGWARSDGVMQPRVYLGGSTPPVWIGATSTDWQYFDATAVASSISAMLMALGSSGYAEFDDVTIERIPARTDTIHHLEGAPISTAARGGEAGMYLENTPFQLGDAAGRYKISTDTVHGKPNTKVIECTTAGLLYVPSDQAYGEWEFDIKPVGQSFLYILNGLTPGVNPGYRLFFSAAAANAIYSLASMTPGSATITYKNGGAFPIGEWISCRLTRSAANVFTQYINGILIGDLTSGTNPVTDATTTTSKYLVLDLDSGDRVANIVFKPLP